ncbi:Low-density lipoprotein receptor-related protein 5 [Cytospora mali]|uniref:Low-density lipoprotein receptor-related protein 5 n=1 Tax=Cytospora mali TaxID=578113 RepID=A0A194VJQ2_CYTMA|nr:Low-density lipoprotein receptor-related protein 5 [Valsa mali]
MGSQSPEHHQQRLYILDADLSNPHPRRGRILSCLTDGSDLRTIIGDITNMPDGIAIDRNNGHIYWTNMGQGVQTNNGSIERANLDGSNRKAIIPVGAKGVFTPKQITIAKRARKLYWCDREGMKVMRANLDGSDVEVLVSTGETDEDRMDPRRWCVGIALDEKRGYFYWTQKGPPKGGQGRIFRAPIDGPQGFYPDKRWDLEVVFDNLPEPIDLEMDEESQTLYWTDRGDPPNGNSLSRAAIGMGGVPQVLTIRLHEAIGLALDRDGDIAYVTDLAGGVYGVDIKTRKKKGLLVELGDVTGIALA